MKKWLLISLLMTISISIMARPKQMVQPEQGSTPAERECLVEWNKLRWFRAPTAAEKKAWMDRCVQEKGQLPQSPAPIIPSQESDAPTR